ncbi:MAG: hypothetical protein WC477_04845 [Patescibacteria group bacterium]
MELSQLEAELIQRAIKRFQNDQIKKRSTNLIRLIYLGALFFILLSVVMIVTEAIKRTCTIQTIYRMFYVLSCAYICLSVLAVLAMIWIVWSAKKNSQQELNIVNTVRILREEDQQKFIAELRKMLTMLEKSLRQTSSIEFGETQIEQIGIIITILGDLISSLRDVNDNSNQRTEARLLLQDLSNA